MSFIFLQGPLYEAVRGPGFCYHQSIYVNPEKACFELNLDECSNLSKAYEATRNLFVRYSFSFNINFVELFFRSNNSGI